MVQKSRSCNSSLRHEGNYCRPKLLQNLRVHRDAPNSIAIRRWGQSVEIRDVLERTADNPTPATLSAQSDVVGSDPLSLVFSDFGQLNLRVTSNEE